jgi:hypothetical protein
VPLQDDWEKTKMSKYFKFPAESDLGEVYQYNNQGWPVRQAECYGGRWFNSNKKYHQELGTAYGIND